MKMKIKGHDAGHKAKMAGMPIYGKKTLKTFYSRTRGLMILKFDIKYVGHKLYKVHIIDDPGLTLTLIMARSNLVTGFSIDKSENSGFLETIAVNGLKIGRCRQLIE